MTPSPARRSLGFGIVLTSASSIAPVLAAAGVSLAIARLKGPSGTGVVALVMNYFDVVLMLSGLGLATGVTYFVSRREWPLQDVSRDTVYAAVVLGFIGTVCGLGFYLVTRESVLKGVSPVLAVVSLGTLGFAISWGLSRAVAIGRDRYEAYAGFGVVYSVLMLLFGVILTALFGTAGAIAGFAIANVVTAGVGITWLQREVRRAGDHDQHHQRPGRIRRATSFGAQAWVANLLQLLNYRLDLFFLSAVASRSTVGVYSVAVSVTALGWILPSAFQAVVFPRIASLDAAAGLGEIARSESDESATRAIRQSVLLIAPTILALGVSVVLIPLIFGARFERSVVLGAILIPGVAALGVGKVISSVVAGRGFPRYGVFATLVTAPVTVGLYFALIPALHAKGAAIASTASYLLTTVLSLIFLKRATTLRLRKALIPTRSDLREVGRAIRAVQTMVRTTVHSYCG